MSIFRVVFAGALLIFFLMPGFAFGRMGSIRSDLASENVPTPTLVSPTTESVDLTGMQELEFKWSSHEGARSFKRYNDFRIYKGYEMIEGTLIFKKEIEPDASSVKMPSNMFENGVTYTWSLRYVFDDSRKSRKSYSSFKVIRR